MKEQILLLLIGCGMAMSAEVCCPDTKGIITPGGYCGTVRMNLTCSEGKMLLRNIVLNDNKVSTLDTPGYIFVEDTKQYCIGDLYVNQSNHSQGVIPVAVVCFEHVSKNINNDMSTSGILTLVSVFFLFATFAVYTYLPQLRDLQGLCYMCMCISMALGFLSLGILQLNPKFTNEICATTGFLVYTWMIATFFWMNVICINMYRTTVDATYLKKTQRKQYFIYNCYAWGGTLLFLFITLVTNFVEGDHWKPGFGNGSCWFNGRTETWIYFYGPIAILIASNLLLFIMSSFNLWKHTRKYEVNKLNNLRYKFLLSLKLFLVMGLTWIFEVASFAHGEVHIIWKIMDTFNCLQGVVIFLILVVLRKRAIQGLARENCCLAIMRPLADKLSPHDDSEDQQILADDNTDLRINLNTPLDK